MNVQLKSIKLTVIVACDKKRTNVAALLATVHPDTRSAKRVW
jgi:hypothetical protein